MITSRAALEIILAAKDEASNIIGKATGALGALGPVGMAAAGGLAVAGGAALGLGKAVFDTGQQADEAMRLFQAQTGTAAGELEGFRDVAFDVWQSGWGGSIEEAAAAMTTVHQGLQLTGKELEDATKGALILGDTFGTDVGEGVSIASSVMLNYGQDADTAFDVITKGMQMGLNRMDDFGDTMREYSSDFSRLGFTAEGTLNLLNAGLEEGAYNTDVIADGVREFGIRFGAAESAAVEALQAIGINTDDLYAAYQRGDITVADAMATITGALADVDDKTLQAQAGAALFGSKWEDIGGDVFMAAGQAADAVGDLAGATEGAGEALSSNLGAAFERLKRTALTALQPLAEGVANAMTAITPYLEQAAEWLGENIPKAIAWLQEKWQQIWPIVSQALQTAWGIVQPIFGLFKSEAEGKIGFVVAWVQENWPLIQQTISTVMEAIRGVVEKVLGAIKTFWDEHGEKIMAAVETVWGVIQTIFETTLGNIFDALKAVMQLITGDTEGAMETLKGIFERTKQALMDIVGKFLDIGKHLVESIKQGVENAWDSFKSWIVGLAKGILDDIKEALGFGSPSKPMVELGRGLMQSLQTGMYAWRQLPAQAVDAALAGLITVGEGSTGVGAGLMAGGGRCITFIIHNHYGPGAVRSVRDIEEIARTQEQLLTLRGARQFGV